MFPSLDAVEADRQRDLTTGLLPSQLLREAVAQAREILSPQPIGNDQIQPASIDLRLGEVAYRVRASFLPGARASVRDKLELLSMHHIGTDPANPGWSRNYAYGEPSLLESGKDSNRLSSTMVGNNNTITEQYGYDAHGNMLLRDRVVVAHHSAAQAVAVFAGFQQA